MASELGMRSGEAEFQDPKSHSRAKGLSLSSDPDSKRQKIFLGILNSTTGAFLISFASSASRN